LSTWIVLISRPVAGVASRMTSYLVHLSKALDGMIHCSVGGDRLATLRHRQFIAANLGVGFLALCVFPVWLALVGPTSVAEALTFAWLVAPLAIAVYLLKSGNLEAANLASAVVFTGLIVWVAALTGGVGSMALVWLPLVPFEASLSGSRRIAAAAVAVAAVGVFALIMVAEFGIVPLEIQAMHTVSISYALLLGAIVCAGGQAIRAEGLARESARAFRHGEERYRLLADHATDMITRHAANGDVEFASPAARALTGATIAEVMGDGLFRRVHIADRPVFLKGLSEAFATRRPVTVEFRLLHAGKTTGSRVQQRVIDVEMRCRPAIDQSGRVSAVVAVTRDVTALRERENQLLEARESADRANRAKTQFLAHMSHELRTPLNAIIGFSDMLKRDAADELNNSRRREYAGLIYSSGEHLLQVVNSILDTSKIESGMFTIAPDKVQLAPLIARSCDMMARQAEDRGLTMVRAIPDNLPEILADLRACRQILLNLLSNAIKFTDRGGTITVGARVEGKSIAIFVRDTGIGILAKDLPHLGTPFVQAETVYSRNYEGTGLGLSTVKGLAALHGGRLAIESKPGVGTTATAFLPIEQAAKRLAAAITNRMTVPEEEERKSA
jgi:two-component system, cell cycle sensor histidine kinase DivJ